jgi:hypothetical protein
MKKIFLLLLLIGPLGAFSQSKKSIEGFLNMPFGCTPVLVKMGFLERGSKQIDSLSNKDIMMFSGFDFSGRNALACAVKFVDSKSCEYDVYFTDFVESDILKYYDDLSADLTAVYGKGELQDSFGDSNNPARIRRLKSGSASCITIWQSKNKNTVAIEIHPDNGLLEIILRYESADLWTLKVSKRRSDL